MPSNQFDDRYDFVTISDFRAGIWSNARGSVTGLAVPAPPGAAQLNGTFKCIALASGGLAPLPKQDRVYDVPLPDTDGNASLGYFNVDGFSTFGPVGPNATTADADDFFLSIEYLKTGGVNRVWTYYRVDPVSGTNPFPSDQLAQVTSTQAPTTEAYVASTWVVSRMNQNSPFLTPGNPVIVTQWCPPAFAADRHVLAFPNPTAPGATGVAELCIPNRPTLSGETQVGDLLGHQGRIVMLEYITNPFGGRAGDSIPTNEQVSWSDPQNSFNAFGTTPNFYTIGTQQEVFALELPNGYGAWGSISAGELFLVKHNGGGLIISGDLNTASVTRLPGVVGAGGMASRAASTPDGLFYWSRFRGVYIWRGSDTSEKVSTPLDDSFLFYTPGPDKLIGVTIDFQSWGDWLVCTNNYLYDTVNKGWWRLDDPASYIMQWVAGSFYGELLYAIPIRLNNTTKVGAIRRYNRMKSANSWSWTSQPIQQYINRLHENRETVIVAEGTSGSTIQVTVTDVAGTAFPITFTLPAQAASQPVRLRLPHAARGYNTTLKIVATGNVSTDPAPILHSISLGVEPTQEAIDR
jgi:hypothetical protein